LGLRLRLPRGRAISLGLIQKSADSIALPHHRRRDHQCRNEPLSDPTILSYGRGHRNRRFVCNFSGVCQRVQLADKTYLLHADEVLYSVSLLGLALRTVDLHVCPKNRGLQIKRQHCPVP